MISMKAATPMSSPSDTPSRPSEGIQFYGWVYRIKRWLSLAFAHAFCLSVAAACLFPLFWMLASSLKTQSTIFSDMSLWVVHPHWENFYWAWTKGHFGQYFFNSL